MAVTCKSPMGKRIQALLEAPVSLSKFLEDTKEAVSTSMSTRNVTYCLLNPSLSVSDMYSCTRVPEYGRIAISQLRLSSHKLKIETGRWSRIPREHRLCQCGKDIQTEEHVLLSCPLSKNIRQMFSSVKDVQSIADLLDSRDNWYELSIFCFKVLQHYEYL